VGLLGPCGAFTESCRSLTFSLSPAGTPESKSFSPDVLSIIRMSTLPPTETDVELTCWSEDPASPQRFPDKTGQSPRTPSVVFRILERKPEDGKLGKSFRTLSTHPHRFAFYPSAPLRQSKLRISSWLAPSFSHRPTLRPTGEEDARCVESTSATQTNYVHPHLACSRLAPLVAQRGRPTDSKAPYDISGDRVFHDTRDRFGGPTLRADLVREFPRATSVGVFFPRRACGRASDTPVATSQLHPQRFVELPRRCLFLFLGHSPAFLRVGVDRRMRRSPSPPIAPSRESRRLVLDWDAFYR